MSFRTYVINLDSQPERWKSQYEHLRKVGIYPTRIPGVLGKDVSENDLEKYFKHPNVNFMPMSMIGCTYSHIIAAKKLLETSDEVALILEDDAYPSFENVSEIEKYLTTLPPSTEWDLIQLHCDGFCSNKYKIINGSTAAYLLSRTGAKKRFERKYVTHIDIDDTHTKNFNKIVGKKFFWTDERFIMSNDVTTNRKQSNIFKNIKPIHGEKTYVDILNYKRLRIPYIDVELTSLELIIIIMFIIIIKLL